MPFTAELEPVYNKIKEVVVLEHGLVCSRADDIYSAGIIIDEISEKILEAHICIADTTGRNPNVFYEMGLAHANEKNVVILAQNLNDIPFDLQHRRVIHYEMDRLDAMAIRLSKTIEDLKGHQPQINQWIDTSTEDIKIGVSHPTDGAVVDKTPIASSGRVVGLPDTGLRYSIQGFVVTNKEYQQGSSSIDGDGFWKINELHLGATRHKIFFRIFDESGRVISKSNNINVIKLVNP